MKPETLWPFNYSLPNQNPNHTFLMVKKIKNKIKNLDLNTKQRVKSEPGAARFEVSSNKIQKLNSCNVAALERSSDHSLSPDPKARVQITHHYHKMRVNSSCLDARMVKK